MTDCFMYTNTELSALKYHHTEEKEKITIITVLGLDKGRRASEREWGFFRAEGILKESVAWFQRATCDIWGLGWTI